MCNSRNWFDARSYCLEKGGDLASLHSPDKLQAIQDYVTDHRLTMECAILFVGLHHSVWLYPGQGNDTSKVFGVIHEN